MFRYAFNTARSLAAYHRRRLHVSSYPFIQGIEVTNDCNLSCGFCKRDKVRSRGVGYMTRETYSKIVCPANKRMLRHVRLFMHGEPLLHKDLPFYVEEAAKYAKTVGITTNGLLLTRKLSRTLLKAGLTSICFSGHSPRIAANIEKFIEERELINLPCHVTVAVIDPYETPYLDRLNVQGVNNVVVMPVHNWGLTGVRRNICLWPWWALTIYWNGDVAPCCLWEEPLIMGNVNNSSIIEIWNGATYRDLRRRMLDGSLCKTCSISTVTVNEQYLKVKRPNIRVYPQQLVQMAAAAFK